MKRVSKRNLLILGKRFLSISFVSFYFFQRVFFNFLFILSIVYEFIFQCDNHEVKDRALLYFLNIFE